MGGSCPDCTDPRDFPQPSESISLNNYIEIIKIDQLYCHRNNMFEIVRQSTPPKELRQIVSVFNITSSIYDAFILSNKLIKVKFTDVAQTKQTYLFVNKTISDDREKLDKLIYDLLNTYSGTNKMGCVQFPQPINRWPYVMPSRNIIFR